MSENLTPKHFLAIEALLTHGNVAEAARAADVSRDTVYRWFKDRTFKHALKAAEADALEGLSRDLVRLGRKAAATLEAALTDERAGTSTKVRAADIVLSRLLQLRELADLEQRVSWLEERIRREDQ